MIKSLKVFKSASYVLLAVFFALTLTGCGKEAPTDPNANKIVVWSFETADAWKSVKKSFEKKSGGYEMIYVQETLDSDYEKRVLNSILAGEGPDVWAMPNDWVYRHKEKLTPMPDKMATTLDLENKYVPALKESVAFDGKIYAMSPYTEPLMVYYNPKIFSVREEELTSGNKDRDAVKRINALLSVPPKTWTDFTEAAKLLTKKDGPIITQAGVAMGSSQITNAADIVYLLMYQNETDILSADYKSATFNLPKNTSTGADDIPGKRAFEFYTSFADPLSTNFSWHDSFGNDVDAFGTGKVAMIFGYSNLQNTLLQKYPDFRYKKAFVPQLASDASKITDFAKFNAYGASKIGRNPTLAWELINILTVDAGDDFNSVNKYYTSAKASSYDISVSNREAGNPEKLSLATAKSLVKGRYPTEFDYYIKNAISSIGAGTQSSQIGVDSAANSINLLLRKETW